MRRVLEIVFRQRRHFLLLMVLLPLLSLVIGFFIPRPYQATGSLWAAKRYNITDATWVSRWYEMLGVANTVPAQAQAGALTELLNSRAFALQVANATDLPKQLSGSAATDTQQRDDALYADISHNVKAVAVGNNLVTITYSNRDAHIAQQVVAATMHTFATASEQLAVQSAQELLVADQSQLTALHQSAAAAAADLQEYLNQHPGESTSASKQATDPQYQFLNSQLTAAQTQVADVQGQIGQLQLQINTIGTQPDAFFSVQDAPTLSASGQSRTQVLLLALGVGAAIALALSALYLAILMRSGLAAYSAADLKAVLSVPVLAEVPAVVIAPPMRAIFAIDAGRARPVGSMPEAVNSRLAASRAD